MGFNSGFKGLNICEQNAESRGFNVGGMCFS